MSSLTNNEFRRSSRLKSTWVVVVLMLAVIVITRNFGMVILALILLLAWLIGGMVEYAQRVILTTDSITTPSRRFANNGQSIYLSEITSCVFHYVYVKPQGYQGKAGVEFFCLAIADRNGNIITIGRYGWGRRHREFFSELTRLLDETPITLDPRTQGVLRSASS